MRRFFSFNRLLNNDKLMMVLSLLLAIVLWIVVISGPANIQDRSIAVTVTVDLTNSFAHQNGLRIIGDNTFDVKVNVEGPWSVVSKLNADDVRVRPDLSSIMVAGEYEVMLNADKNSNVTNYDILSVTPSVVSIKCDSWMEGTAFKVDTDVSALKVTDDTKYRIGDPVVDMTAFPDGKIIINGPRSEVGQIQSLVARVDTPEVLTEVKQYTVPLVALDKNGKQVDLTHCEIQQLPSNTVTLTVPVWEQRHVEIGYTVLNAPEDMDTGTVLTSEPSGLELLGPSKDLDEFEEQISNVGTVDFSSLSLANDTLVFPLSVPSNIRMVDTVSEVKVTLNTEGMAQKIMSVTPTLSNVSITGNPKGLKASIPTQTISSILIVGKESSVNAISAAALTFEIDLGDSPKIGKNQQFNAVLRINGYDDVWAYYGEQNSGYSLYVDLS